MISDVGASCETLSLFCIFFPMVWVMVEIRTLYLNDNLMVVIAKNLGRQK